MTFMGRLENAINDRKKLTENQAVGYVTTGKSLLDMNFAVGSMRQWSEDDIIKNYVKVYYENQLLAVKWLFYLRDIRGAGMGERHVFMVCMKWLVLNHMDYVVSVIGLIPEYGRYDDWMCLLDTEAKDIVLDNINKQLQKDTLAMFAGENASLLAKWLPSCNTSSDKTRRMAYIIYTGIGMTEKQYRKTLSKFRSYIDVAEVKMSSGNWQDIDYSSLPSRANLIYARAFLRNDEKRRKAFLDELNKGNVTINADTLFPGDIVSKYFEKRYGWSGKLRSRDDALEGLWKSLPDYTQGDGSTLVVRDGSGSMNVKVGNTSVTALDVSTALAIYFAEHSKGEFHNKFITFSSTPQMIDMSGALSLRDKLEICGAHSDYTNTDIQAVFELILNTAVNNKLSQDELPKNILIVSDMEFDMAIDLIGTYGYSSYHNSVCVSGRAGAHEAGVDTLFESIGKEYKKYGYDMPRLIFWNVCSRTNTIPLRENKAGVVLVSGFNPAVYNMVLSDELNPYKCLLKQINAPRYDVVEAALTAS